MDPRENKESPSVTNSSHSSFEISPRQMPSKISQPRSSTSKAWSYLNERIRPSALAEFELILLTFCIGLQDAVSFPDFHCFASNQTGNTVFLVLAIVIPQMNGEMFVTANIGVALGLFLAAAWLTGQIGHMVGPRRRLWVVFCNFVQTCLVFGAAGLQFYGDSAIPSGGTIDNTTMNSNPSEGDNARTLVAIGLLASAAGSQVVLSRALEMTEISTAMATAAWIDLVIDPNLCGARNRPRNRRVAFLVTLVLGSLAGAFVYKTLGSPTALAISGGGKLLVTGMFFFNGAEAETMEEGKKRGGQEGPGEVV